MPVSTEMSDIYKNIVKQYYTYPKQGMALKTEQPELFIDTAIELTELRKQAFEMDSYDLGAGNLPSKIRMKWTLPITNI